MHICFVNSNIYPLLAERGDIPIVGGAEVQQYLIGRELAQRGITVSYVTEDLGQGPETVCGPHRVLAYRYNQNKLIQAATLWRALHRAGADVYYVRGAPNFGAFIYAFCRLYGRKVVQALAYDPEVMPETDPDLAQSRLYQLHAAWRSRADLVIAQTDQQALTLRKRWRIQALTIRNIVSVAAAPKPIEADAPLSVLWVGSISPRKRVESVAVLAKELPNIEFTVVGGPMREDQSYYDQVRHELAVLPNIRWTGYVPYQQVRPYFQRADLLLHTGDGRREGFPNVFLQAWAEGLPVVSIEADPDHLLTEHRLGIRTDSLAQTKVVLDQLAQERVQLVEIGRCGWQYVAAHHSIEVVIERYLQAFQSLMGKKEN